MIPPVHCIVDSSEFSGMIRVVKIKRFMLFNRFEIQKGMLETSRQSLGIQTSAPSTGIVWKKVSYDDMIKLVVGKKFRAMAGADNES